MSSNQRFEKSVECPTNESLLDFLHTELGESAAKRCIVEHLVTCEFCELSLELLRAHPAQFVPAPAPAPPVPNQILQLFPKRRIHK